ncbi:MAG: hypothetical protein ACYS99_00555 [Planctomycetota bacterium]
MEPDRTQVSEADAQAEETGTSSAAVDAVRDVFTALEKALKIRRLYEPTHSLRRQAEEDLAGRFAQTLDAVGTLDIDVSPEALICEEEVVHGGDRRDGSMALSLFQGGVRTISFSPGLDTEEIRRLLEVLEIPSDSPRFFDEDVATLLWRQNFRHVEYVAVDEIGLGEKSGRRPSSASAPEEMGRQVDQVIGAIAETVAPTEVADGLSGIQIAADLKDLFEMERRVISREVAGEQDGTLIDVPEEALARLRAEVEADDEGALAERAVAILFDIVDEDESSLDTEGLQKLLGESLRACLERGDLPLLNRMVDRLEKCREDHGRGAVERMVGELIAELSHGASMSRLKSALRRGYEGGPEVLSELLTRLEATSLGFVASHAVDLAPGPERDVYRRILISRGPEDPSALSTYLEQAGPEEVREVLEMFLSVAEASEVASVLSMLLGHPDAGVAVLALSAAEGQAPEVRQNLLNQAIGDVRLALRVAAYRLVEQGRELRLLDTLVARLDGGGLEARERSPLIHAIAVLGGGTAVTCLRRHVGPRGVAGFWTRRRIEERREAIIGLADVTDEKVRAFLTEGASSRDRRFAEACRTALLIAEGRQS